MQRKAMSTKPFPLYSSDAGGRMPYANVPKRLKPIFAVPGHGNLQAIINVQLCQLIKHLKKWN
jgi:hypothetical protein